MYKNYASKTVLPYDAVRIGLFNNGSGWKWADGTPMTFSYWTPAQNNINQFPFPALFGYGPDPNYRNTWWISENDDAAVVCQKKV